ncbi:MAG: SMC family ATPase [Lachnospiraceae bacterium]|nr:SMC family ATPase [Lachnospiraceae bacterium]
MRPITLTMQAFGPYADKVTISMDKLGEKGVYLVTGDTGAGKTTIFDAITFALYGEASGGNREASMFRSKYADAKTKTYVELEFLYKGQVYRVVRNPEYMRPKDRGEGVTKQKAEAILYFPGEREPVTKSTEVTKEIIQLIGLDKNQFTQIVMVAQGDFLKLLLAKTEERSRIFRDIFHTKPFMEFQEKLKLEAGKLEKIYLEKKRSIWQYVEGIYPARDNVMAYELEEFRSGENLGKLEEFQLLLERMINYDQNILEKKQEQLREIEEKIDSGNKEIGKGKIVEQTKASLAALTNELEKKMPLLKEYEKEYEEKKREIPQREKMQVEIETRKNQLTLYERIEQWEREEKELFCSIQETKQQQTKDKEEIESLKQELQQQKKQLEELVEVQVKHTKLQHEIGKLEEEEKLIEKLYGAFRSNRINQQKLIQAEDIFRKNYEKYQEKIKNYYDMEQAFFEGQAGVLASRLKEGEKCPVCGSTNHPSPAKLTGKAPTKELLEHAKLEKEKYEEGIHKQNVQVGEMRKTVELEREQLLERVEELGENIKWELLEDTLEEKSNKLKQQRIDIKEIMEITQEQIRKKDYLEKQIPNKEKRLEVLRNNLQEQEKQLVEWNTRKIETERKRKEHKDNLEFPTKDHATKYIGELEIKWKVLCKGYEKAEKEYLELEREIEKCRAKAESCREQLKEMKEIDYEKVQQQLNALFLEKEKYQQEKEEIALGLITNKKFKSNIARESEQMEEVHQKWSWISSLSATANGNITGKEKIMLETYVQIHYLEKILERANVRLMEMSSGQYELVRKTMAENQKSQTGLELDVLDHYNGTYRSVKTLSGGESFMASLSLALGLADEVQAVAGGIQMDTMFVDEGFGSLDEETLNQAIKTLNQLAKGNRLVGIISHVGELKEKIEKQIVVKKQPEEGSNIYMSLE